MLYIEPERPCEVRNCGSLDGKLRDECLNGEIFYSLKEVQVVIRDMEGSVQRAATALGARLRAACPRGL